MFTLVLVGAFAEEEEKKAEEEKTIVPVTSGIPWLYNALPYNYYPYAAYAPYTYTQAIKPVEIETVEYKLPEVKPIEVKPIQYELPVIKPIEVKPIQYELPEIKPIEVKPIQYELPEIKPITYTYQPVETKFVPKEYEIPITTYEFDPVEGKCKNVFGVAVPCKRERRSAEEAEEAEEVEAPEEVMEEEPEEEKKEEALPIVPYGYGLPLTYGALPYAYHPLQYNIPAPVEIKALEPKVHEIEVPTPVFKKVVQKIPVGPACQNAWGWPVACNLA